MDNKEIFKNLSLGKNRVAIELGCGNSKKMDVIGIDLLPLPSVDVVADFEKGLPFIDNNSVDIIYSDHLLEHIENFELLITDIFRILKENGKLVIRVPHFSNPHYYSDYTHKRFFGLYSFDYFSDPKHQLKRKVPTFYNTEVRFIVSKRKLVFKSRFFIRGIFKRKIIQPIFNINKKLFKIMLN